MSGLIRKFEPVSVRRFGAVGDYYLADGSVNPAPTDDTAAIQRAITETDGNVDFGSDGAFYVTGPMGFPANTIYSRKTFNLVGAGASIVVSSSEAVFTSLASMATPEATTNLYAAKVNVSGLNFVGVGAASVVFNGDRLYNLYVKGCNFSGCTKVVRSFRTRNGEPDAYIQSIAFVENHFTGCTRIIEGKRAFNLVFSQNFCESNAGGIYVDGTGDPCINVLRVNENLWEGGGVFLKLGAVLGGSISGNYFEANSGGDIPTLKCHVYMVRATGGYGSGMVISGNAFQAMTAQKTDVDWRDIKYVGSVGSIGAHSIAQPVLSGNWTNSYQLITEGQIFTQFGNGATNSASIARMQSPRLHTEARVSYILGQRTFLAETHLAGGVFTVAEISTTAIKAMVANRRPLTAELNLFLQQKTSGLVVTGACVAKILLVIQGPEGANVNNQPDSVFVGGTLMAFAEIPAGGVFDTVFNSTFKKHFTAPALSIVPNGADNFLIKLSGFAAPTTANYGAANQIQTHGTLEMFGLNSTPAVLAGQLTMA